VRGPQNQPAAYILNQIDAAKVHSFDQTIRSSAIRLANQLHFEQTLSINFLPNAVY
jgi:hypothetical protein